MEIIEGVKIYHNYEEWDTDDDIPDVYIFEGLCRLPPAFRVESSVGCIAEVFKKEDAVKIAQLFLKEENNVKQGRAVPV